VLSCKVDGCQRPAVVEEIYLGHGGSGKIKDPVCSHHTGRLGRLQMIGRTPVVGEVEYTVKEE
jgi:hypothetical protein